MSEAHMKRAAEWFLSLKEIPIEQAHTFLKGAASTSIESEHQEVATEPLGPILYDTGLDAGEGQWAQASICCDRGLALGWGVRNSHAVLQTIRITVRSPFLPITPNWMIHFPGSDQHPAPQVKTQKPPNSYNYYKNPKYHSFSP